MFIKHLSIKTRNRGTIFHYPYFIAHRVYEYESDVYVLAKFEFYQNKLSKLFYFSY